jgi:hypothetical protein
MREPGARVDGHAAVVRGTTDAPHVVCSCGGTWPAWSLSEACLLLARHLQSVVRRGARVIRPDEGGGVREPRRPHPSAGPAAAERG